MALVEFRGLAAAINRLADVLERSAPAKVEPAPIQKAKILRTNPEAIAVKQHILRDLMKTGITRSEADKRMRTILAERARVGG